MARPLRIQFPGALYYITAAGNENKTIFNENPELSAGPSGRRKKTGGKKPGKKSNHKSVKGNHIQ